MSRPRIILNFAISADAKISTRNGDASGWTSDTDTQRYFQIRQKADAVLVGRSTQEADNMSLTTPNHDHWRCIISRNGRFDPQSQAFTTQGGPLHLIVTDPSIDFLAEDWNACVHSSLENFLQHATNSGVQTLLCEGGGQLVRELAAKDFIDEINLTWAAHTLIGGRDAPSITGILAEFLPQSQLFTLTHFEPHQNNRECFLTYSRNVD